MTKAVNKKYDERFMLKELSCLHMVSHHGLLLDLKHLVGHEDIDDEATKLLDSARVAIETSSHLPGHEFLELVGAYVEANEQVHVVWTPEKLQHVLDLTKKDRLQVFGHTPAMWIRDMVRVIAQVKGWVLERV